MKSKIIEQIEAICGEPRTFHFADVRVNGRYRLKFERPVNFTGEQIKRIEQLPHVERAYNNKPQPGTHNNYATVIIDCKPSKT